MPTLAVGLACLMVSPAWSAPLYWDVGAGAGIQGGDGNWNTSTFWNPASDGSCTAQNWTPGADAHFTATDAASTIGLGTNTYTVASLVKGGAQNLTLQSGALNISGNITVTTETVNLGTVNLTGASGSQTVRFGNATTTLSGTLNIGANDFHLNSDVTANTNSTFNMALSGSGNLIFDKPAAAGSNKISIGGNNGANWTGDFVVNNNGYAQLTSSTFFTNKNLLKFDANGLVSTRNDFTVGGLSGSTGSIRSEVNPKTMTIDTSVLGDASFGGNVVQYPNNSLLFNVLKTGSGTQVFSGTNTYLGTTAVNQGSLLIDGTHSGGGAYSVANGARLGGKGVIGSTVTLAAGATLAPGGADGLGTLTLAQGATLGANSTVSLRLAGDGAGQRGVVKVTGGTLDLSAGVGLNFNDTGYAGAGGELILIEPAGGTVTGTFKDLPQGAEVASAGGGVWILSYTGGAGNAVTLRMPPAQITSQSATGATDVTANLQAAVRLASGTASLTLFYGPTDGGTDPAAWTSSVDAGSGLGGGAHGASATGLTADTLYHFNFRVTHPDGSVRWGPAGSTFGTRFPAGVAPAEFAAQDAFDHVRLSWTEGFASESGFLVQRSTSPAFDENLVQFEVAGQNLTSFSDESAVPGQTYYYRVAAVNAAGLSAWSTAGSAKANASEVVLGTCSLTASSIFDLSEETRKRALRGTREASVSATINGVTVPLGNDRPFAAGNFGAPTDSAWYSDPFGTSMVTTLFREPFTYSFDFGDGLPPENLNIVPVHMQNAGGSSWRDNILLDLGYYGDISVNGTEYRVEIVQGAWSAFKQRLNYPGFFNDPQTCVFLYNKLSGQLLPGLGRLKKIDGSWYAFETNARGNTLTVKRIDATGIVTLDTGAFPKVGFRFEGSVMTSDDGWLIELDALDFQSGPVEIPAANYRFSELSVNNAGLYFLILWDSSFSAPYGELLVPKGGQATFAIGRSTTTEIKLLENYDPGSPFHLYNLEGIGFRVRDADLGGAVIPSASAAEARITSYTNSAGRPITTTWQTHPCGWDGLWSIAATLRDAPQNGYYILAPDPNPPGVSDIRTIEVTSAMSGLYGSASDTISIPVINEQFSLHGRFFTFADPLSGFPEFNTRMPVVESNNAPISSAVAPFPWPGMPSAVVAPMGAVYTFEMAPLHFNENVGNYTFTIAGQGHARLFVNNVQVAVLDSPDSVSSVNSSTVQLQHPHRAAIRLEYYQNAGAGSLKLTYTGFMPPYYNLSGGFEPDKTPFRAINPASIPSNMTLEPLDQLWIEGGEVRIGGHVAHPDSVAAVEFFLNDNRIESAAPDGTGNVSALLSQLPLDANVGIRVVDTLGFGTLGTISVRRDSMAEWLQAHGLGPDEAAARLRDSDGDGLSDAAEYNADTNPLDAGSRFATTAYTRSDSGFLLRWTGAGSSSKVIRHYAIERSPDLIEWTTDEIPEPLSATGEYQRFLLPGPDSSKEFYRIRPIPR